MQPIQLQLITHRNHRMDDLSLADAFLRGGGRWVQLRMKETPRNEILRTALQLRQLCNQYGAQLILNDDIKLALEVGADGVHLGRNDCSVSEARSIVSTEFIIGGTANTLDDMLRLCGEGVDYIGLGPFRFTTTKEKLSPILGIEGYRSTLGSFRAAGWETPIVAIGGIVETDIKALLNTGIDGIALASLLLNAADPIRLTQQLIEQIDEKTNYRR